MAAKKEITHKKRPITEVDSTVPANFKFGIIVAIAIFWAQFIRSLLESLFSFMGISGQIVADLFTAVLATLLGYIVLLSYRKIRTWLEKVKL